MTGPSKEELIGGAPNISLDVPGRDSEPQRPSNIRHVSNAAYETPLRHHQRKPSTHRHVKETLHAHSEWSNSGDDGAAVHRINQYIIKEEIGRGSFGAVHLAVDQYGQEYVCLFAVSRPGRSSASAQLCLDVISERYEGAKRVMQAVKEFSKSRLRKRAQSNILRRPHGSDQRSPMSPGRFSSHLSPRSSQVDESQLNPLFLIQQEIAIMKKLNHPNLVSLLEVLDDPAEDSLYMVLEMCKKGVIMKVGMHEPADPYDSESCRCWFRDLILGIEYLHAQGVAHRDIKPDNLLLTEEDELKIVDFGVSEMFEKSSDLLTAKSAGSPAFLPPELCVTKHGNISGKAADIWSMGITLYCLYFGRVPFEKTNILELYESIRNDPVWVKEGMDPTFQDLVFKILEKDPDKRIKMGELRDHPWVTRGGLDPLMSEGENVASIVELPTAEEVDRAITKNLGNLLVVVKAVAQFKKLLYRRRPSLLEGILGQSARIVQPPLALERPSVSALHLQTRSEDIHDRRPIEGALSAEGVQRDIDPEKLDTEPPERDDGAVVLSPEQMISHANISPEWPRFPRDSVQNTASPPVAGQTANHPHPHRTGTSHEGRGQAHDPLMDTIYLGVGTRSTEDDNFEIPTISESPPADDTNIYEMAYKQEIERIRREHGHSATVYSTRRVDRSQEMLGASGYPFEKKATKSATLGGGERQGALLGKVLSRARARNDEKGANSGQATQQGQ